jgi:hypothetical protein
MRIITLGVAIYSKRELCKGIVGPGFPEFDAQGPGRG